MSKKDKKSFAKHKALAVFGIILCVILIPIIIVNLTLIVMSFVGGSDTLPSIGGYFPLAVKSGSMSGTIEVGDLIFVKSVDDVGQLEKGDVITYWDQEPGTTVVTHRITAVITDKSGSLAFATKGDANVIEDEGLVSAKNVLGVYRSRVPALGDVVMFMQTPYGMILCVGGPLVLLIAYDMIRRRKYQKAQLSEKDRRLAELEEQLNQDNHSVS